MYSQKKLWTFSSEDILTALCLLIACSTLPQCLKCIPSGIWWLCYVGPFENPVLSIFLTIFRSASTFRITNSVRAAQPVKHPRVSDFSWRQGGNQRKNIILTEPPNAKWKPPQHLFDKISQGSRSWRQESVETFQPSCLQIQIMQLHLPSLGKLWKSCCFAKELILFLQSLDHRKRQGKKNERMDSFRILKFETAKQSKLQTKIPFPKRHLLHHPVVAHGPSRPNETTSHEWNWRMLRLQGSYFVLVPFSNSLDRTPKKVQKIWGFLSEVQKRRVETSKKIYVFIKPIKCCFMRFQLTNSCSTASMNSSCLATISPSQGLQWHSNSCTVMVTQTLV